MSVRRISYSMPSFHTFAVNNPINENHHLKRRIIFEDIPSEQKFLAPIIESRREGLAVEIRHRSFWKEEKYITMVEPYFVRLTMGAPFSTIICPRDTISSRKSFLTGMKSRPYLLLIRGYMQWLTGTVAEMYGHPAGHGQEAVEEGHCQSDVPHSACRRNILPL